MTTIATRNDDQTSMTRPYLDLTDPMSVLAQFLGPSWPLRRAAVGSEPVPCAEIEETDDAFTVDIDLPGIDKKDIKIDVAGRRMTVEGTREERKREGVLRHTTRTTGRFSYEVIVPSEVNAGEVTATLTDGVLTVRLPKSMPERPQQITIT